MAFTIDIHIDTEDVGKCLIAVQHAYSPVSLVQWGEKNAYEIGKKVFKQNFETEGGRLGRKWKPLADETGERRAREGFVPFYPILYRTGHLKETVVEHKPVIRALPDLQVVWGHVGKFSKKDYAIYASHQGGAKSKKTKWKLPARPMVGFNKEDEISLTRSLVGWIGRQIQLGRRKKV